MESRFVVYYRVSTALQGRSGLGLEAQRVTVMAYLNGGNHEGVDSEFGKNRTFTKNKCKHYRLFLI